VASRKLQSQCRRAERLGVASELAALLARYLDQVEQLGSQCEDFRWGDACDHVQLHETPSLDPVMYQLGPLVAVTYEARKGGDLHHWEHEFESPLPLLAFGDSGSLWILGGGYRVTHRGIVG